MPRRLCVFTVSEEASVIASVSIFSLYWQCDTREGRKSAFLKVKPLLEEHSSVSGSPVRPASAMHTPCGVLSQCNVRWKLVFQWTKEIKGEYLTYFFFKLKFL